MYALPSGCSGTTRELKIMLQVPTNPQFAVGRQLPQAIAITYMPNWPELCTVANNGAQWPTLMYRTIWGRDRFDQRQRDRELLAGRVLNGHMLGEVGFVRDDGVWRKSGVASAILFIGWTGGVPESDAYCCYGISCGAFVLLG